MTDTLDDLVAAVATLQSAATTCVDLVQTLAQEAAAGDAASEQKLQGILSTVNATTSQLQSAVTAASPPVETASSTVYDPGTNLPLYSAAPGAAITPDWTAVSDVTGPGGETLYTFSGDTPGGAPTGTSAEWAPFTGTTVPA